GTGLPASSRTVAVSRAVRPTETIGGETTSRIFEVRAEPMTILVEAVPLLPVAVHPEVPAIACTSDAVRTSRDEIDIVRSPLRRVTRVARGDLYLPPPARPPPGGGAARAASGDRRDLRRPRAPIRLEVHA